MDAVNAANVMVTMVGSLTHSECHFLSQNEMVQEGEVHQCLTDMTRSVDC
jgi:hypothetical protein